MSPQSWDGKHLCCGGRRCGGPVALTLAVGPVGCPGQEERERWDRRCNSEGGVESKFLTLEGSNRVYKHHRAEVDRRAVKYGIMESEIGRRRRREVPCIYEVREDFLEKALRTLSSSSSSSSSSGHVAGPAEGGPRAEPQCKPTRTSSGVFRGDSE